MTFKQIIVRTEHCRPLEMLPPKRRQKAEDTLAFIRASDGEWKIGRSPAGSDFSVSISDLVNAGLIRVADKPGKPLILTLAPIGGEL